MVIQLKKRIYFLLLGLFGSSYNVGLQIFERVACRQVSRDPYDFHTSACISDSTTEKMDLMICKGSHYTGKSSG